MFLELTEDEMHDINGGQTVSVNVGPVSINSDGTVTVTVGIAGIVSVSVTADPKDIGQKITGIVNQLPDLAHAVGYGLTRTIVDMIDPPGCGK